jgi:hypothetical protein
MKKNYLLLVTSIFVIHFATAQSLAINSDGSTADASALLDVKSSTRGILIPRMTKAERTAIPSPATGLLVFQSAPDSAGFYYYDGSKWGWVAIINGNADSLAWKRNGNAGTTAATHFIGTTDNRVLNFRVNNIKSGLIDNVTYNSALGYSALLNNAAGTHNTAFGFQSMINNSSGNYNTAVGAFSAFNNSTGIRNTAIGTSALFFNTANDNTAVGYEALNQTFNIAAKNNTAVGSNAMRQNSSGTANTAVGDSAGYLSSTGSYNVHIGKNAGRDNLGSWTTLIGIDAGPKNTASGSVFIGSSAGMKNTSGSGNTFIGDNAGRDGVFASNNSFLGSFTGQITTGSGNSFFGRLAGYSNTFGTNNVAMGYSSLYSNTSGSYNIAIGVGALSDNTTQSSTIAIGDSALANNGTGAGIFQAINNTAVGSRSLYANTTATDNTAVGYLAMEKNTVSSQNTYVGSQAGRYAVTGGGNAFVGYYAGNNVKQASSTVAIGSYAFGFADTLSTSVAIGASAASFYTRGEKNVFVGYNTVNSLKEGDENTVMGYQASVGDTAELNVSIGSFAGGKGNENVFIGHDAGKHNSLASMNGGTYVGSWAGFFKRANYSVLVGYNSNPLLEGYTNATAIGYNAIVDASNKVRIGNTGVSSIGGQVSWTTFSDGRYKQQVEADIPGIEFIRRLKPVSYTVDINSLNQNYYKITKDPAGTFNGMERQIGFIAQDVEKAAQDLNFNFSGVDKPQDKNGLYGLRYAEFVVPLVKAVQEQQKEIEELKKQIEELKALIRK